MHAFPIYFLFKALFLMYLFMPQTEGAEILYNVSMVERIDWLINMLRTTWTLQWHYSIIGEMEKRRVKWRLKWLKRRNRLTNSWKLTVSIKKNIGVRSWLNIFSLSLNISSTLIYYSNGHCMLVRILVIINWLSQLGMISMIFSARNSGVETRALIVSVSVKCCLWRQERPSILFRTLPLFSYSPYNAHSLSRSPGSTFFLF